MECWIGQSLKLLPTITRAFFSRNGYLNQGSIRVEEVHPSYRTEERILAVSSSTGEKFVSFICCLLFFQIKGILCEPLQLAPNLKMNTSCSRLPEDSCEFACERGYDLIGSSMRRCNTDGKWTGTQPRCDGEQKLVWEGKNWYLLWRNSQVFLLAKCIY